jgi:hypothetical protein
MIREKRLRGSWISANVSGYSPSETLSAARSRPARGRFGRGRREEASFKQQGLPPSLAWFVIRFEVVIAAGSWSAWKRYLASRPVLRFRPRDVSYPT